MTSNRFDRRCLACSTMADFAKGRNGEMMAHVLQREVTGLDELHRSPKTHLRAEIPQLSSRLRSLCTGKSRRLVKAGAGDAKHGGEDLRLLMKLTQEHEISSTAQQQFHSLTTLEPGQQLTLDEQSVLTLPASADLLRIKNVPELSRATLAGTIKKFETRLHSTVRLSHELPDHTTIYTRGSSHGIILLASPRRRRR
ncbi:hypothetical protein PV04_08740 [Phialophora macrospora]|uniref:Uncharacterized protein n=1 Tax=Phialophora macrospora TaxID=1851006 RepID=A0A0D2DN90_9EURO|nr:hypothetical protein PV04_08740 [Phialophora macrospora]